MISSLVIIIYSSQIIQIIYMSPFLLNNIYIMYSYILPFTMLNLTRERTTMEISFKLCCAILGAFYICIYYMNWVEGAGSGVQF